ncbi:2OG-Fe(II) oxygenase family protein [Streptomyces sp. NPDC054802]
MSMPRVALGGSDSSGGEADDGLSDVVARALADLGAMTIGLPPRLAEPGTDLLFSLFDLGRASKWEVARRSIRRDSPYEWVGYGFDGTDGVVLHETFDLGSCGAAPIAEVAAPAPPLRETTPLPTGLAPGWLAAAQGLRLGLSDVGRHLVALIAGSLGRNRTAAESRFHDDGSTLRVLNYPALPGSGGRRIVRARRHEDSGAFTFIWQDRPGLEIRDRRGSWLAAPARSWTLICGEVMAEMTGGAITATPHRVTGTSGRRRSLAYFFEPGLTASVLPWPAASGCEAPPDPEHGYGRWLLRRHGA